MQHRVSFNSTIISDSPICVYLDIISRLIYCTDFRSDLPFMGHGGLKLSFIADPDSNLRDLRLSICKIAQ